MITLTEGIFTNKELAEWFGIKESSFKNQKKKKLEELKFFADFVVEKGKVKVTHVKFPVYNKQLNSNQAIIQDNIDKIWNENGLDTCSRVALQLKEEVQEVACLAPSTVYKYTIENRNALYGRPFGDKGSLGKCKYLWCKKIGDGIDAEYRLLTEEEEKIKQELIKKYFGDATEKQIIVKGMVENGEIRKDEAWEVLEELTHMGSGNFMMFLGELQEKLECQVIRGTMVERLEQIERWS